MDNREKIQTIFSRIAEGQHTDDDLINLRQWLSADNIQGMLQLGKNTVGQIEGQQIQVGDRYYYSWDDEAIQAIVAKIQEAFTATEINIYNYYKPDPLNRPTDIRTEPDNLPCPYRGLFHFSPKDAEYFFGRDSFIAELYQSTQTRNFIPVLGASGSGKSSVVFAGLVPKLQQEGSWQFTYFRPGVIRKQDKKEIPDPFYALATALVPLYEPDLDKTEQLIQSNKLANGFRSGEVLLSDVITRIQNNYPDSRILLIADQFEEIYTVCTDQKERRQFLDILIDNIYPTSSNSPLVLVLTMRADFLGDALSYASFAEVLNSDIKLGAMNHTELREVIEKPAQKLGVTFAPGLVENILDDVEDEPGNLPLLEFALTELWQRRKGTQITYDAYQEIGKVQGALTRHADRVLSKLTPGQKQEARRIFIKLVNLSEGTGDTRRQVTQAEIGSSHWHFVKQLADDRLVVTSQNTNYQETVEVVHEALIRNWSQLREWIDESRDAIRTARKIEAEAKEWETKGQNKGYLLQDRRLRDAKEFMQSDRPEVELSDLVKEFIKASQRKQTISRFKLGAFSAIIPLIGTLVMIHFSLISKTEELIASKDDNNNCTSSSVKYLLSYYLWWVENFDDQVNLSDKNFCEQDLRGFKKLAGVTLENVNFKGAKLIQTDFQSSNLQGAQFLNSTLYDANFYKAILWDADFQDAKMEEVDLSEAELSGAKFSNALLRGAKFKNADLTDTDLSDAKYLTENQVSQAKTICRTKLPPNMSLDTNRDCPG